MVSLISGMVKFMLFTVQWILCQCDLAGNVKAVGDSSAKAPNQSGAAWSTTALVKEARVTVKTNEDLK